MRDGMQVTWRGRIGPATLSKPEAMGSSEVSAQEHYETSPGRKVPRPSEQVRQAALRGLGLKAQAKDRSLRDKVIRGGGVKKKRQIDPGYKILSARSVPQWGDTNVSLIGDSTDAITKGAAAKAGGKLGAVSNWLKGLFATPKPTVGGGIVPTPGVAGSANVGGIDGWKKHKAEAKALTRSPKVPAKPKVDAPVSQSHLKNMLQQQKAVQSGDARTTLGLAEQQGMKVGPWAKMVGSPTGSMLMQMAAMSAIEPLMYGMGIRSPILGGVLPFMAMQHLPGLLESSAGIPRMQQHLSYLADRGKLALPRGGAAAPAPMTRAASPGAPKFMAGPSLYGKTASVVIPEIATVFG